jgi:hypothetical protein
LIIEQLVENFFKDGQGLRGVPLKNYTSGDKDNSGFETLVDSIIHAAASNSGIDLNRMRLNGDYFNPPEGQHQEWDPQRMDHHVWVDDKCVLVVESRAWIDKPFMTLKRAVVRNFMELEYVRSKLSSDVSFMFVALAIDIKPRLVKTLDETMGHGDRVRAYKLSPHRRGYKGGNYFDNGINYEDVKKFYDDVSQIFRNLK